MATDLHNCRACGYESDTPPWGPDGRTSSFDICPSCGVEWGYEDISRSSTLKYRAKWLEAGGKWTFEDFPHDGLTTEERLSHVPPGFA